MPVMTDYDTARWLKAAPKGQAVIMTLTASGFEKQRVTPAIGCNDFVSQPCHAAERLAKLTQYLGVQYVYEESGQRSAVSHGAAVVHSALAVDTLAVMSIARSKQWHSVVSQGSDRLLEMHQSPADDADLTKALHTLTDSRFDYITALIEHVYRRQKERFEARSIRRYTLERSVAQPAKPRRSNN